MKYFVESSYLFYVFVVLTKFSQSETRANSKEFPLEWWQFGAKTTFRRWELVCLSKKKGGLEVKCLSILNKAPLSKWNWRFTNERETLWNQVIRGKYGEDREGWCSREVREAHGVGLWNKNGLGVGGCPDLFQCW